MTENIALETISENLETTQSILSKLTWQRILMPLLLLVVCCVLVRLLCYALQRLFKRSHLSEDLQNYLLKFTRFFLCFVVLLIVADSLGIPVTSLLAVFSLLGLAISLSLQSLLGNLFSGIYLLWEKPFVAGEYISIGEIEGNVKQVSLFHTQIRTLDNKLVMIPNSDVSSATVTNYTREGALRIDVPLCASYDDAPATVRAAVLDCISSIEGVLPEPAPVVLISSYGDSNINYIARIWCRIGYSISIRETLPDKVWDYYQARGISISYQRVVLEGQGTQG